MERFGSEPLQDTGETAVGARPWPLARTAGLAALLVAAVQILLLLTSNGGVLHGTLFDADCYMHLQRAFRLMTEGGWHNASDPRINAPYGYAIHWTTLFDGLLAMGAAPLHLFGLDLHQALYLWGSAISPVLLAAALAVFAWGVRPWIAGATFLWLTVLVFTQAQLSGAFIAGRPDHHSLILGLLLAQLACAYAVLDGRAGLRTAIVAGVLGGIEMATSVEGLLTVVLIAMALALGWAVYGRATLGSLAAYLGVCVTAMMLWLAWESGARIFEPAYDHLSIVHVVVLGAGFLTVAALSITRARWQSTLLSRFAGLGVAAGIAVAMTAAIFPDFFLGPWPHIDPIVKQWHQSIQEIQPLLPVGTGNIARFLGQLGAPLLSLPLIFHRLRHGELKERPAMLLSLCGIAMFGGLTMAQMRWSAEVQAVALLPWTLTTVRIMQSGFALTFGRSVVPMRSAALMGALLLQLVPGVLFPLRADAAPQSTASSAQDACSWNDATRALGGLRPADGILLTTLWQGPQILWRTGLRVVAAPYEMAPAMRDSFAALYGDEAAAHAIVARRGINFILVCGDSKGFAAQLARGTAPAWLQPIALQRDVPGFRLYRVRVGAPS
jgi:hypothetical protein